MSKFRYFVPFLIFSVVVIFLWQGLKRDPHLLPSPLINKKFPDFQQVSLHNRMISNADFKGHITLLNVFATWCITCQVEHPILMDIARLRRVVIVGLNYKDKSNLARAWLQKYGNPYQIVISDPDGKLGINLGVYGTPETYLIDQYGMIRYKHIGAVSPDVWQHNLSPIIKRLKKL